MFVLIYVRLTLIISQNMPKPIAFKMVKKCNKVIFSVFFVYVCLFVVDVAVFFFV